MYPGGRGHGAAVSDLVKIKLKRNNGGRRGMKGEGEKRDIDDNE